MNNEHNPIAQLITQIQNAWLTKVSSDKDVQLVQWLIKPEEAQLYNGFLKLESSPHGSLDEVFLTFLTPFKHENQHSGQIIEDWIKVYKDNTSIIEDYRTSNPDFHWDLNAFETKLNDRSDTNHLLLEMLQAFQEQLLPSRPVVLALTPYTIESISAYSDWLGALLRMGVPKDVKILVYDHVGSRHFDKLIRSNNDICLSVFEPVDLEGAISKLANSGNPNEPEVQLRQCMFKMSEATKQKDLDNVHRWGKKALEVTQRTADKNLFSSAHLIYAAMLFNFKEFETIDHLLDKGLALAKQGKASGDDNCNTLLVQYYGFKGSSYQHQKKKEAAFKNFVLQAETALEVGFPQQALNAWWLAYNVIRKKDKQQYKTTVKKAYLHALELPTETLTSTVFPYIAHEYFTILEKERQLSQCEDIDIFMKSIEGPDWKERIKKEQRSTETTTSKILNLF